MTIKRSRPHLQETAPTAHHKTVKKRRGNGGGTVWKEGSVYRWQLTLGYDQAGKRLNVGGQAADRRTADAALAQAYADHQRKILPLPDTCTVAEYAQRWLKQQHDIEPRTVHKYGQELAYALESIGDMRLQDVRPALLKDVVAALSSRTMRHGQPMAKQSLGRVLTRLRALFREAVVDQIIYVDPMHGIKKPKIKANKRAKTRSLNFEQEARFIAVGHALHQAELCQLWPLLYLLISTGLRRSEVLGLQWQDVDFAAQTITIARGRVMDVQGVRTKSTKSDHSDRRLPVPPAILQVLSDHREAQDAARAQFPEAWTDPNVVFATSTGEWTHLDNVNRAIRSIVAWSDPRRVDEERPWRRVPVGQRRQLMAAVRNGAKLPHCSAHDLRHTYATLALRRGVAVNVVSKALGHSSVAITLSIYRHVSDDEVRAALALTFQPPPVPQTPAERTLN